MKFSTRCGWEISRCVGPIVYESACLTEEWKSIAKFYHIDRDFGLRCMKGGLSGVFDRDLHGTHFMTRGLPGYLRYAREQGVGVVALHRLHGDILGSISLESFTEDLPGPVRVLIHAFRRPRLRRAILAATSGWIAVAGMFRMTALQIPAARLARRIELVRGAREALYSDPTRWVAEVSEATGPSSPALERRRS